MKFSRHGKTLRENFTKCNARTAAAVRNETKRVLFSRKHATLWLADTCGQSQLHSIWLCCVKFSRNISPLRENHARACIALRCVTLEIRHYSNLLPLFNARRSYAISVLGAVILSVCPSVCLSVRKSHVFCDKTKQCTADILIPHEKAITLLLRHQQWLVGDAPFLLKFGLKVTHPFNKRRLQQISPYNVSTIRYSEKSLIVTNGSRPRAFQQAIDGVRKSPLSPTHGGSRKDFFVF